GVRGQGPFVRPVGKRAPGKRSLPGLRDMSRIRSIFEQLSRCSSFSSLPQPAVLRRVYVSNLLYDRTLILKSTAAPTRSHARRGNARCDALRRAPAEDRTQSVRTGVPTPSVETRI